MNELQHVIEILSDAHSEACPGCLALPGEGYSSWCNHRKGCGFWKFQDPYRDPVIFVVGNVGTAEWRDGIEKIFNLPFLQPVDDFPLISGPVRGIILDTVVGASLVMEVYEYQPERPGREYLVGRFPHGSEDQRYRMCTGLRPRPAMERLKKMVLNFEGGIIYSAGEKFNG